MSAADRVEMHTFASLCKRSVFPDLMGTELKDI